MTLRRETLSVLPGDFAVCRLEADALKLEWVAEAAFYSITRTRDELSIVCPEADVPDGVCAERGWKALEVRGPIAFTQTGVLASLVGPLAQADISVFVISSYDTDYVLVKQQALSQALSVLAGHGHQVV